MARKISALPPQTLGLLHRFGERLHLLRVRRRLSAKQVAAATGMSVMTLRSLERGGDGVTIGAYLAVMEALGIERDLEELAAAAFLTEADDLARTASVSRRAGGMARIEAPAVTVAADAPVRSPGSSERAPEGIVDATVESAAVESVVVESVVVESVVVESAPVESAPVESAAAGDARVEEVMVDGADRPVDRGGFEWLDVPGRDLRRLLGVAASAESGRRSSSQKVVKPKAGAEPEAEADADAGAVEVTPDLFDAANATPAAPS